VQFIRLIVLIVFVAATAACAGGENPVTADAAQTTPDDVGGEDAPAHDTSDAPGDAADIQDDPCGVCCPGERTCSDETTASVCADDGSQYVDETCGDEQICEAGSCVDEPVCQPGETVCLDGTSRNICRPDGTSWRAESCDANTSCIDGECLSGAKNGASCGGDADCAGGKCRCGSDESCSPSPSVTYCTATCTPGSCGSDEICVASDSFNGASYDHCLPTCDQTCPHAGMRCASLPTRDSGDLTYEQACYFEEVINVGEPCTSADNCSGGTCLKDYYDSVDVCTYECSGDCPSGTACVELVSGTYHCAPLCGDGSPGGSGDCPLGDIWGVSCGTRTTPQNFAKRVCVANSP
jgi:hypothetical protein